MQVSKDGSKTRLQNTMRDDYGVLYPQVRHRNSFNKTMQPALGDKPKPSVTDLSDSILKMYLPPSEMAITHETSKKLKSVRAVGMRGQELVKQGLQGTTLPQVN